jgi:sec-independent protein translocase protein TatB
VFDVSFVELLIIGVVALLVLGPERLPAAARTVGGFMRKARQTWNGVRSEFEREIAADEFKRSIKKTRDDLRAMIEPGVEPAATPATRSATAAVPASLAASGTDDSAPAEVPPRGPAHPPHD